MEQSPASFTRISWFETRRRQAGNRGRDREPTARLSKWIGVSVGDRGRAGQVLLNHGSRGDLESAIRHALAHSRQADGPQEAGRKPPEPLPQIQDSMLWDEELSRLGAGRARQNLRSLADPEEVARLAWWQAWVVVAATDTPSVQARATSVHLEVRHGRGAGEGRALAAGRRFDSLQAEEVFGRARSLAVEGKANPLMDSPVPLLLAPEASAQLLSELNRAGFTAQAYRSGSSFLRDHLSRRVFHPLLTLVDDGTREQGMPFPFDLEGKAKHPVVLIQEGVPRSPALDENLGRSLGLPPTPHAAALDDCRAENLFLAPGDRSLEDLLTEAEQGIWIGWWDRIECFDPRKARIRATSRGARRIRDGRLAEPVQELVWEDSLLRSLAEIRGVGRRALVLPGLDPVLGAVHTPALLLGDVPLRPA